VSLRAFLRVRRQVIQTLSSLSIVSVASFEQIYRWLKMAFESYSAARLLTPSSLHPSLLPKPSRSTQPYHLQPRPSSRIVRGESDAVTPPLRLDRHFKPRFRILVIDNVRGCLPMSSYVFNSPSERRRKIKYYQHRLRDK
jgi:hypothetical protein